MSVLPTHFNSCLSFWPGTVGSGDLAVVMFISLMICLRLSYLYLTQFQWLPLSLKCQEVMLKGSWGCNNTFAHSGRKAKGAKKEAAPWIESPGQGFIFHQIWGPRVEWREAQMRIQFSCSLPDLREERPALRNECFPRGMMHCLHHFMCFSQKSVGFLEFLLRIPQSPTWCFHAHVLAAACFCALITEAWGCWGHQGLSFHLCVLPWKENPRFSEMDDVKVSILILCLDFHPPAAGSGISTDSPLLPSESQDQSCPQAWGIRAHFKIRSTKTWSTGFLFIFTGV